ncbi:MAG: hypothetical protein ACFCU4_10085 [Puniceicoccaceae bacterium]
MNELRLVLALVLLIVGANYARRLPPDIIYALSIFAAQALNLGMTVINTIQSIRRDPRYLPAKVLGLTQTVFGLGVSFFIYRSTSSLFLALSFGGPIMAGGLFTLTFDLIYPRLPRRRISSPPRESSRLKNSP